MVCVFVVIVKNVNVVDDYMSRGEVFIPACPLYVAEWFWCTGTGMYNQFVVAQVSIKPPLPLSLSLYRSFQFQHQLPPPPAPYGLCEVLINVGFGSF